MNLALRSLIGDYMYNIYFDTKQEEEIYKSKYGLKQHFSKPKHNDGKDKTEQHASRGKELHEYVMRDLFLWAIIMNRIEMAKVFLCFMKYRICPALIATKILKKYHEKAEYGHAKDSYIENANYFEKYAVHCLDYSDDEDPAQACEIILQQNELYGYVTCLEVCFTRFR